MQNLKLALAAALLCGSAILAAPAFAGNDAANAPAPATTQPNASTQDMNENQDANDEQANNEDSNGNGNGDMASNDSGEHGLSTPEEKAETASLNQAQLAAGGNQGNARSGITRGTMGQSQGGVTGGTTASQRTVEGPAKPDQSNDDNTSNDANGGDQTH